MLIWNSQIKNSAFFLVVTSLILTSEIHASQTVIIGKTYDIAERDAEEELLSKVEKADWKSALSKPQDEWSAIRSYRLPVAQTSKTRFHIPWYTSEMDVKDKNGRVIYKKGYTFNPLIYTRLPNRLFIVSPSTVKYLMPQYKSTDQILLSGGNPFEVSKKLKIPVFTLDNKTKERLGVTVVPSIVSQKNTQLLIEEFSPSDMEISDDENL